MVSKCLVSSECRCMRRLLHRLLSSSTHALSMLVIAMIAMVATGDMVARVENFGNNGRNNTVQYAVAMLRDESLSEDERLRLLKQWSTKAPWNTEEGIYYAFSLFSTIGFGRYVPVTVAGRVISALFIALIVPIGVLYVQCLSSVYQSALSRLLTRCRLRLKSHRSLYNLIFPIGDTAIVVIPVTLLTIVLHLHLLVAILFLYLMEEWNPMESLYYLISATTTIGFGDLHTGPHSLSYVLATITFQLHLCAIFMQIINYLNDALEWILQISSSRDEANCRTISAESLNQSEGRLDASS